MSRDKWLPVDEMIPLDPPTMTSTMGLSRAWEVDFSKVVWSRSGRNPTPEQLEAQVCAWLILAPYAHPIWHSYMLACYSLVPLPGQPDAHIYVPGATHEMLLMVLDPAVQERYDLRTPLGQYVLTPCNFAAQFIARDKESAASLIRDTVRDVVDMRLNPDTDYLQHWIARFGAGMIKGDPSKAGQTVVRLGETEVVIPPVPAPKNDAPKH